MLILQTMLMQEKAQLGVLFFLTGSPISWQSKKRSVECQKWQTVQPEDLDGPCPHNQIDSGDNPYLVCGYPSNHIGFVGYHLGTSPDLPVYI
jgi:hypothetical protein